MVRALAFFMFLATLPATAQMLCGPRADVLTNLTEGHGEYSASMGLASNGAVIEVFVSAIDRDVGGRSFTIVMTRPDGLSCLMAAGNNWEDLLIRMNGT
ncbi:hypothetical protein LCGC14_0231850 [marine sediment metagenome]|uniref:Uncharacterized protein n=1 Tax=marine sediment metagenome TaxID=412755 RepID=A0A0F9URE2_9ZZZZ